MKILSEDLREALVSATYLNRSSGERPHRLVLAGQLPKKVYGDFKRVLSCLGGQWERGKDEHSFMDDPRGDIEEIVRMGRLPELNPYDYFPTPAGIVEFIMDSAFVEDRLGVMRYCAEKGSPYRALEPEAGTGAFASALAEKLGGPDRVVTLELNPINCRHLRAQGFSPVETDFLRWTTDERFSLIVMNPPFDNRLWRKHLDHAMGFLAPMGRLVCIAPVSALDVRSESDKVWLRGLLNRSTIEHNPKGAFSESGTNVDTLVFFVDAIPARVPMDGWSYGDLCHFHILVHNDSRRQARYSRFFSGEGGLLERLGTKIAAATSANIPPADASSFIELCRSLNDELLTDRTAPVGLVIDDSDFLECLNYELIEYRIQHDIEFEAPNCPNRIPAFMSDRGDSTKHEVQLALFS